MTLTLSGLSEETTERLSTAYTVVGLRDLLKAKGAPHGGPKAELTRKLAEFEDGPDLDLVEPSRDPAYQELMESNSSRDLVTRCAEEGIAVEGAKDELAIRILEHECGEGDLDRRRGSRSEFYSWTWDRFVTRDDRGTGDAGESYLC